MPGFRDYAILPTLYGLAGGFVHVPLSEQWGLVINEAAAAGLPIIVSYPCGAASTLVEPGSTGWIVDPHDTASMAEALLQLMKPSPEKCRAMGQASASIVEKWGPRRFALGLTLAANIASKTESGDLSLWDKGLFKALARYARSEVT